MPSVPMLTSACCLLFLLTCSHCSKNSTDPPPGNNGPDTTSHNFVWQIDTLGPLTTTLSDVAFISETEAWAVGRIQFVDSAGANRLYGLAKQDGALWNFQEIEKARNDALLNISGIFALEHNDIWLAAGSVYHWTGGPYAALSWQRDITSQEIARSVWSGSNEQMFAVGSAGLILTYDGNNWTRHGTPSTIVFRDIFGSRNTQNVWACGFASNQSLSTLIKFNGQTWDTIWETSQPEGSPYSGLVQSLWYAGNDTMVVVGSAGVFWQDAAGNSPPRKEALGLGNFPYKVRGNAANDFFIVGDEGMVWHYNGASWKKYTDLQNPDHFFYSIAVKNNQAIIIGLDISQGLQRLIIVSGQRE